VNAARVRTRPQPCRCQILANKTFVLLAQLLNGMPVARLHSGHARLPSSVIRAFSFDGEGDALPIDTVLWPRAPATTWSKCDRVSRARRRVEVAQEFGHGLDVHSPAARCASYAPA